jgi:hypothetical protein
LRSLYGDDIFPDITEADDIQGTAEEMQANDEDKADEVQGDNEDAGKHEENNPAEEVQGDDKDAYNVEEEDEAEQMQDDDEDASNSEQECEAEEVQGDDEDADDNGNELLGLLADMATTQDDMIPEDMHGNEAKDHGTNVKAGTEIEKRVGKAQ